MNNKWRKELENLIDENISELIKETKDYDYAIKKAKDKSKAQIWVALGILNYKIKKIELISNKQKNKKIPKEEMEKILTSLEKL